MPGVMGRALLTFAAVLLTQCAFAAEAMGLNASGGKYGVVSVPTAGCTLLGGVNGNPISFRLTGRGPTASSVNVNPRKLDRTYVLYLIGLFRQGPSGELYPTQQTDWSQGVWLQEGQSASWPGALATLHGGTGSTWLLGYSFEWWRKKRGRWQRVGWYSTIVPNYSMSYSGQSMPPATSCSSPWGPAGPAPLPPVPWP